MTEHARAVDRALERIEAVVPSRDVRLRGPVLYEIADRCVVMTDGEIGTDAALIDALIRVAGESMTAMSQLDAKRLEIARTHEGARDEEHERRLVREHLTVLSTDRAQLAGDLAATRRWLDLDALLGRLIVAASEQVDRVQMAYVTAAALAPSLVGRTLIGFDRETCLEICFDHIRTAAHEAVRVEALRFATALVARFGPADRLMSLGPGRLRQAVAWAEAKDEGPWVRVAALELAVTTVVPDALDLLAARLMERESKDGMIVRNNALRLVADAAHDSAARTRVAMLARDDPSEHVRQGLARALARIEGSSAIEALAELALHDDAERVRAYALRELAGRARHDMDAARRVKSALCETLAGSVVGAKDRRLDIEVALLAIRELCSCAAQRTAPGAGGGAAPTVDEASSAEAVLPAALFVQQLEALLAEERADVDLLREAATLLVALDVQGNSALRELAQTFAETLKSLDEGKAALVELFPDTPLAHVEKALLVAARGDLSVSLHPRGQGRYRVTRGERRGLRLWRLLFELRTPSPDKRQTFYHSHARLPAGSIVVPPPGMGEVTPTRPPGERRWLTAVKGWGEFLPMVDDLLAASTLRTRQRRVVTGFGTIVIRGPESPLDRLWIGLVLSLRYKRYADERDRALEARDPEERQAFVTEMRRLGFTIELERSAGTIGELDYSVTTPLLGRYLGSTSSLALPLWLEGLVDEVLSPSGNTAWHLAVIVWLAFSAMLIRGAWIRSRIEAARQQIPLTIGGWGSRGKSGTERIKAALFHALRYDVVVKTTGCEAMMIHARRDLPAHEIFVYRPYDKATIWEQEKIFRWGARLGAQVFMWECMALRPQFVRILQEEWMRSPICTLTNAYPDHEDVMGPSGEDVARVIATFMPPSGGLAITAEEQMLPIVVDAARTRHNELVTVSGLEGALLPADLLARFPYAEHPRNIAMVLALAEHFGIDREWALVKMADHVVPDLGVLKVYPTVPYRGRVVTFSNGMSANERAGFLSNWTRLGFGEVDPDADAETVTVTVVNNRADRVPRSRVFAELLTRDVVTDFMVLIGTNLGGLQQFFRESLDAWLADVSLGKGDMKDAHAMLEELYRRVRVPQSADTLARRVRCVLGAGALAAEAIDRVVAHPAIAEGDASKTALLKTLVEELAQTAPAVESPPDLGLEPGALAVHVERLVITYQKAKTARDQITAAIDADDRAGAEKIMRACFRELWLARVSVIESSHAKGDAIIDHIARLVPPGHHARLLGCQNIKGTGLDFAYRWVGLATVAGALEKLEHEPAARDEALRILSGHGDYGLIDTLWAKATLKRLREQKGDELAAYLDPMATLESQMTNLVETKKKQLGGPVQKSVLARAVGLLEPWVDHLDSILRQRVARRIMNDLMAQRVSQGRAALLLRDVVARGKGGWASQGVEKWLAKRRTKQ